MLSNINSKTLSNFSVTTSTTRIQIFNYWKLVTIKPVDKCENKGNGNEVEEIKLQYHASSIQHVKAFKLMKKFNSKNL